MKRRRIVLTVTLIALASCSSGSPAGSPDPSGQAQPSVSASGNPSPSPSIAAVPSGPAPASPAPATATPTATPPAGKALPAPGEYVYAQSGNETFCSATACGTPRPLPDRMYATVGYGGRVAGTDAYAFEFRIASGRTVRIDAHFVDAAVTLHRFEAEFTEAGITQNEQIVPSPPMTLLKFPLEEGKRWSGTFTDGDSRGDYAFRAVAPEEIQAGGRRVRAWKVDGTIEASGDGEATITLTMWLDPATRTFMRIAGSIDATYDLARYKSTFTDTLSTSPR